MSRKCRFQRKLNQRRFRLALKKDAENTTGKTRTSPSPKTNKRMAIWGKIPSGINP